MNAFWLVLLELDRVQRLDRKGAMMVLSTPAHRYADYEAYWREEPLLDENMRATILSGPTYLGNVHRAIKLILWKNGRLYSRHAAKLSVR